MFLLHRIPLERGPPALAGEGIASSNRRRAAPELAPFLPPTEAMVGSDMGVAHLLTTSGGDHVANPRFLHAMAEEPAEAQRNLSTFPKRTRQRTRHHRAAARKVAQLHARIRRQRADFHHKTARTLVAGHDVIAHERLNTAGMTKSPAPKAVPEQPGSFLPNGAAAKAGLNRSFLDAGWAEFLGILANKAESAGRLVVPVDARNTPRTCPECEHATKENRVTQAKFACTACGFAANADHVGATNVLNRAGLVLCVGGSATDAGSPRVYAWMESRQRLLSCVRAWIAPLPTAVVPSSNGSGRISALLWPRGPRARIGGLPRQLGGPPILTRGSSLVKGVTARGSRPGDHCREITAGIRSTPPPSHSRACAPGRPRL
ncbi:RNA-guided endonuclease InsQ/TnpB family protein [Streptomyces wuyuanensis]|uniref:RNA-guided endonuclease InsQ/TnpB family protein n=1 Tax=Streptomyces wuyuanensis TaxID=1196353 RepID=UPI00369C44CB